MSTTIEIGGFYRVGKETAGSYKVALREGARYVVGRYSGSENAKSYVFEILSDEEITEDMTLMTPTPRFANYTSLTMDGIYDTFKEALDRVAVANVKVAMRRGLSQDEVDNLYAIEELHAGQLAVESYEYNLLRRAYTEAELDSTKSEQ